MKWLAGVVLSLVLGCCVAQADKLGPRAFTEEFARALTAAMPQAKVAVRGELQLQVSDPDGRERTLNLLNAFQDYSLTPERFAELVRRSAAAMAQSAKAAKLDPSRIVPVIKDRQWLDDVHATLKARGTDQEQLAEPYNKELVIVYAEDDPTRTRYLTTREEIGVAREKLRALAVENLKRILPKIEMRVIGDVSIISAGGDYEASLLLLDEIWSGGQIQVRGDIVVAIPVRDALLVTGSRSRNGVKALRELAAELAAKGPHALTTTLFVYRDGKFTKFGRN
jgi:uncharacterized protein YtpQ (UPF0354 family)